MNHYIIKIYLSFSILTMCYLGCSHLPNKAYYIRYEGIGRIDYYTLEIPSFNFKDSCISYKVSYGLDSCFNIQTSTSFKSTFDCQKDDTIVTYYGMTLLRSAKLNDCWEFEKPYFPSDKYRACLSHIAQDTLINGVLCERCYIYTIENLYDNEPPLKFYYDLDRRLMIAILTEPYSGGYIRIREIIQRIE